MSNCNLGHCFIAIFLIVFGTNTNYFVQGQCVWNLNTDLPAVTPLYFTSANLPNMIIPTANGLTLATNEAMTLVCSGKTNTVFGTGKQELNAVCNGQNNLLYNGQLYSLNQLYCVSTASTDIILTGQACGAGEIMLLGYNSTKGFNAQVTTCYDRVKETVLYSKNILYGQALPAAQIDNNRPSFRSTGLTYGTTAANCYKQTEQVIRFTALLGATQANKFLNSTSYLARGHVAPDGDYLFATWASTTYYLVNAAPQWQNINAGNWLRVENYARDVAVQYQENISAVTGVHDVLQLPNTSGQLIDMYLMNGQLLKVPKWYWKILYSENTKQGIAFVTSNNPFLTSLAANELLCPNICGTTSWSNAAFLTFTKGYTYCCDVNTLLSAIGSPLSFDVVGYITGTGIV